MRISRVEYLHWHKHRSPVTYDLAISGVPNVPLAPLLGDSDDFEAEASRCGGYGHPELTALIAMRYGLSTDRVQTVQGTSMANFVALTIVGERGGRIVLETPIYEPIRRIAESLGADIIPLPRTLDAAGAPAPLDLDRIEASLRYGAVAVVLTNHHNPFGVRLPDAELRAIIAMCEARGAHVVIDEAYLDAGHVALGEPLWSAASGSDAVVVASSLTKVYGLSALRAGWVAAAPDVRDRARALIDHMHSVDAKPATVMALRAMRRIDEYEAISSNAHRTARRVFDAWLRGRPDVHANRDEGTFFSWLTVDGIADTTPLADRLLADFDTRVTPGHFFGAPEGIRIGFLTSEAVLGEALDRIGRAIDVHRT